MKQVLFAIFAHPDDEAFGPSGTLLKEAKSGTDVHFILATDGAGGVNTDKVTNLADIRLREWRASAAAMQATSLHHLGFQDGELSNSLFHTIADLVEARILQTLRTYREPVNVRFLTFDSNGLSGHLDHIAISMITSYVFCRLKDTGDKNVTFGNVLYFCLPHDFIPEPDVSYVFMPKGRSKQEVHLVNDVSDVLQEKLAIMKLHYSQRLDAEYIISRGEKFLTKEHFYLLYH